MQPGLTYLTPLSLCQPGTTPRFVLETEGDKQRVGQFKEPDIPPIKKVKKSSARKAALLQEIYNQIPEDVQWIFTTDQDMWPMHLPKDWTTSGSLLNSLTRPLWAALPPMSRECADVQNSWYGMFFATQKVDEFLGKSYTTADDIKTALKFLPKVTLDKKLVQANSSLIK